MNPKMFRGIIFSSLFLLLITGCLTTQGETPAKAVAPVAEPAKPSGGSVSNAVTAQVITNTVIRINAGGSAFKDSQGNAWAADSGFNGGDSLERPEVTVTNTTAPELFRSEHYGMDSYSTPLPNGKYTVKLYFSEAYEGISGPGQRVFSFDVQGKKFEKFDVWVKAGGPYKAYVETVPVEVKEGKLLITFTTDIENPQVNGIEITPQP